jgi:hypothetical protein
MFNSSELIIGACIRGLEEVYVADFGHEQPGYPDILRIVAQAALERIADSNALYHNLEHTILVTTVGQEILRGKKIKAGGVSSGDWLHFVAALLCHDIGYVRGVCLGDTGHTFVIDEHGEQVTLPRGASDAALTPYHVDRGKMFVRERFRHIDAIDVERLAAAIELTRFPVPCDGDHEATDTEPGLLRAADLIGQLADPHYMRKINALFHEFLETGTAAVRGYETSADLAECYPKFFWQTVRPYVGEALDYLRVTQSGKQWIANLYSHVFAAEHEAFDLGPETRSHCQRPALAPPSTAS